MTSPVHRKNEMLKAQPRFLGKVGVCVIEGRGLPKMDRFGGTDAYCEVEFAGMVRHTEVAQDGLSPFWNAEFDFDVENRMRGMKVTVFDQELSGSVRFNFLFQSCSGLKCHGMTHFCVAFLTFSD